MQLALKGSEMYQAFFVNHIILLITVIAAALVLLAVYLSKKNRKKFRLNIDRLFGKIPPEIDMELQSISSYWNEKLSHNRPAHYIDSITWNDLDMDNVFLRINACHTSVGEEYLYALLHEPALANNELFTREHLIDLYNTDPGFRLDTQVLLSKMGKTDGNNLSSFCFDVSSKKIRHTFIYTILALLPLLFIGLIFLNPAVGVLCLIASFAVNTIVYYRTNTLIKHELPAIRYFSALLWCAGKICAICTAEKRQSDPIIKNLEHSFLTFKDLRGKLSGMAQRRLSEIDALIEYVRIIFFTNIRRYNKILNRIEKNTDGFHLLYKSMGELDSAISVLSFRKNLPFYAHPVFGTENQLIIKSIYHPLLTEPVPNTLTISKNSLISGSNASGKSTFIKAVAINGIMAQTIYTCTASQFKTRFALVMTSMAVRDDLLSGESYFIAEIRSLKRIIQKTGELYCICLIDEILKGTNTTERIAASVSVLRFLKNRDCLCIVATHDIELTRLLSDLYDNYHFSEQVTDQGVFFDYVIKDGPSKTKNAIKLLDSMGYDARIVSDAEDMVKLFEETQSWE